MPGNCRPTDAPLVVALESEDEFSTLISAFVFCFVIHRTGKSSQSAVCRGNLPVSGMQSGQFLRFHFSSPSPPPLFPFVPSCMQTIIMYISFPATSNCIKLLHPGWMQFIQYSPLFLLCDSSCCLVLSHWFPHHDTNENTLCCTWQPLKSPAMVLIGSADFLVQQSLANGISTAITCLYLLFLGYAVVGCLKNSTKLW